VLVREHGSGVLVAVVDALGHGPRAAEVAQRSTAWLATAKQGESVAMMEGLHDELRGSRGAAALLLMLSSRGVDACSVGNVELRSSSGSLPFVLTPGVLGLRLRAPRSCFSSARVSERLVLFSDGLSGRFDLKNELHRTPAELATKLFSNHRHAHDDATVVVIDVAY
jgi:negative regulator of sigma-B (phosphoserine phosphatase)